MKPGITAPLVFTFLFIGAITHAWWSFEQAADLRDQARDGLISAARFENTRLQKDLDDWLRNNQAEPAHVLESLERGDIAVSRGECLWPVGDWLSVERVRSMLDDDDDLSERVDEHFRNVRSTDPWLVRTWIGRNPAAFGSPARFESTLEAVFQAERSGRGRLDAEANLLITLRDGTFRARLLPADLLTSRDGRIRPGGPRAESLTRLRLGGFDVDWVPTDEGRAVLDRAATSGVHLFSLGLAVVIFIAGIRFLQKSRSEIARRADMRERLVADISHELRTPVTTLRLYAEMLRDGRVQDPEKHREYCESLVRESSRLGRLIDNVLDFSRLGRGVLKVNPRPTALSVLDGKLRDALAGLEGSERLEVDLPEATVNADIEATLRILVNLVGNALKYADGSPVRVTADNGRILVSDEGPGLPDDERATIFEPFVRGTGAQKEQIQGTGLGLAIARDLARAQGGDLECLAADRGARFRLSFGELPA